MRMIVIGLALLLVGCARPPQENDPDEAGGGIETAEWAAQFGVGTFRVIQGNSAVAWLSVNGARTQEVWVYDDSFPTGVQNSVTLRYEYVVKAFYNTPKALRAWVEANKPLSKWDGGGIAPTGHTHAASTQPLPAPVQKTPGSGAGTFRVKIGNTIVAWVSVENNRNELWVLSSSWQTVTNATLVYEEAIQNKAFTALNGLHWWILNNKAESGLTTNGPQPSFARVHLATAAPTN